MSSKRNQNWAAGVLLLAEAQEELLVVGGGLGGRLQLERADFDFADEAGDQGTEEVPALETGQLRGLYGGDLIVGTGESDVSGPARC